MLVRGNSKLGKSIWQFSIPAGKTCPGRSKLCDTNCYAQKGMFYMPAVQKSLKDRLRQSEANDFANRMIEEIKKKKIALVRIHVAGDLYNAEYAGKWYNVVKACSETTFFIYTRSWRVPEIRPILVKMSKLPNMKMWWSTDAETGRPPRLPKKVRTAYMSLAVDDIPDHTNDMVFRDYPARGEVQKYVNGVLVCPQENGLQTKKKFTCDTCRLCFSDREIPKRPTTYSKAPTSRLKGRVALPMTA